VRLSNFITNTKTTLLCLSFIGGILGASGASAHRRDFPVTYDWHQPLKGEKEIESHTDYRWSDKTWEQQLEFEYGVTSRFMVAPYLVYAKEPGGSLRYDAFKLETRYQLGNEATGKVLPGLYLEFEKPKGEKLEIEGKIILSTFTDRGEDWSLNLVTERSTEHGAKQLYTYSAGYARPLGHGRSAPRGGFELVRDIDDGRLNFGPVFGIAPRVQGTASMAALIGYGFPLDHRGGNKGELRLLVEYEWF
jgi:hypothetical protein